MNKVDHIVKNMMLGSPALFPTRLDALAFAFLNAGAGYHWTPKGELDCIYGMSKTAKRMHMKDLRDELKQEQEFAASNGHKEFSQRRIADVELRILQRRHLAKHIDLYVTSNMQPNGSSKMAGTNWLRVLLTLDGTALGAVGSVKSFDKHWAAAADEVAAAYLFMLSTMKKERGTLSAEMQKLEAEFLASAAVLEAVTQRKARTREAAKLIVGMFQRDKQPRQGNPAATA